MTNEEMKLIVQKAINKAGITPVKFVFPYFVKTLRPLDYQEVDSYLDSTTFMRITSDSHFIRYFMKVLSNAIKKNKIKKQRNETFDIKIFGDKNGSRKTNTEKSDRKT